MSEYDEMDEFEDMDEIMDTNKTELEDGFKETDGTEAHEAQGLEETGKLGESDEDYYRKKQAEAEAKGLEVSAEQYKEKADAEAIYEKIK
jgi:hypothetical protein